MTNIAVLGSQVGDEGKGRVIHDFSINYDWVIRFNGSGNAGHTIYRNGKKYVHHLLPSVDWRKKSSQAFLGSGMVINPQDLLKEIKESAVDFPDIYQRIVVDPYAFLIEPEHIEIDKAKNQHIGTTNKGVGPAYLSKYSRSGKRIIDVDSIYVKELMDLGVRFKSAYQMLPELKNKSCLFEGAQGIMLDVNHGNYPYVTTSDTSISGIGASGFNSIKLDRVFGIAKAYTTKVGEGPFPTELFTEEADELRRLGSEFGATTGRPRRVGWLDLPALKYACDMAGITDLVITKLDILSGRDSIPVCTHYSEPITGSKSFFDASPVYKNMPGWKHPKNIQQQEIKDYIKVIEEYTERNISHVSVGVDEVDLIKIK